MDKVWIVSLGDGEDGNEWMLLGIYSTSELADLAKFHYENKRKTIINEVQEYQLDQEPG